MSPCRPEGFFLLVGGGSLNYIFSFLVFVGLFRLSVSAWLDFSSLWFSTTRNWSITSKLLNNECIQGLCCSLIIFLSGCRICCDSPFHSRYWWFMFSYFFILISLPRGLSVLFVKINFFVSVIFLYFPVFSFIYYFFSFLCVYFVLSSFSRWGLGVMFWNLSFLSPTINI